jgi:hypothetical protein
MAILQISRIQHRSGNQVDLPQLAEAELGWATDTKRLFIGKTTPNENIEVMTAYSNISFSQITGAIGNLNINPVTLANGQALVYDGSNWVNRGGDAGGLITLGNVSNVNIEGGGIGYVLETDGLGNLSWTPKSTIVAYIQNVTAANPAVVTTTQDNFFTDGAAITITNAVGMTQLNGNSYYANVLTSNTFSLYTDSSLTTPVNSSAYTAYGYTTVSATTVNTNLITVAANVQALLTVNAPVRFTGNIAANSGGNLTGLLPNVTYYVKSTPSTTTMTVSSELLANGVAGNVVVLSTATSLSAAVYQEGGRAVSFAIAGTSVGAGGSNSTIQYNNTNLLDGDPDFTYNDSTKLLTLNGNANVGNLNATGVSSATRYISNIATGTAPLTVTSTTQVANLNVATSGSVVNGNSNVNIPAANGNVNISAVGNANIVVVTGTGANVAGTLRATGNANVGNIGATTAIFTTGNITTINSGLLQNGNSNVTITANANVTINAVGGARIIATSTGANVTGTLGVSGNANVGNLGTERVIATGNISGTQLISNIATGTAPLVVTSTTQVANLSVATAGAATNAAALLQNTSSATTVYPTFTTSGANGNSSAVINTSISANLANGAIIATTFVGNVTGNISGTLTAPGSNTQVIFNDTGNANATSGLTFNKSTNLLTVTGNVSGGNLTTAGVVAATGNVSGGNLTTAGVLSVTGNANVGNIGATTAIFTTGNITTINSGLLQNGNSNVTITANANVTINAVGGARIIATSTGANITGTLGVSGNISGSNVIASAYLIRSVGTGIAAAGTTQGTATAISKELNLISSVPSTANGIVLPTAVAGMVLTITNSTANAMLVYPASGAAINSLATNAAFTHTAGATLQFVAPTTTQWYSVGATYA